MWAPWLAVVVCTSAIACGGQSGSPDPHPVATRLVIMRHAPTPRGLPKSDRELPTTSGAIYFGNLEGQIAVQRAAIARDRRAVAPHRDLGGLRYVLARHHGDPDEVQAAIDEVSRAIELAPDDPALYVLRAQQTQTLHRFAAAHRDLERARSLGGDARSIDPVASELDYAQGRYDTAIPAIRRAAAAHPTLHSVARLALLEHELGNPDAAERAFDRAETLVRDSSPIPVAWLYLQRGMVAMQAGDHARAIAYLRDAVRRAPGYIAAEEHLAEALAGAGRLDEAIALYESIVGRSKDPEFRGALAELYRGRGRITDADRLAAEAKTGYEQLIARYPEAMSAHATEFFLGEGRDASRALALARADVGLRPTARAFTALARAELATGDARAADRAIRRALAAPTRSAESVEVAAEIAAVLHRS